MSSFEYYPEPRAGPRLTETLPDPLFGADAPRIIDATFLQWNH